jgi:hypothetical protein
MRVHRFFSVLALIAALVATSQPQRSVPISISGQITGAADGGPDDLLANTAIIGTLVEGAAEA